MNSTSIVIENSEKDELTIMTIDGEKYESIASFMWIGGVLHQAWAAYKLKAIAYDVSPSKVEMNVDKIYTGVIAWIEVPSE